MIPWKIRRFIDIASYVLILVFLAYAFSNSFALIRSQWNVFTTGFRMRQGILSVSDNRIIILLVINLLLLFVGMLMEANVAILIFTPILLPIAVSVGMSTLTLGVLMTINLCLGLLTPPVGLCLIMGNDIAKANFGRTLKRALPFFIISLFVIALVTYWPAFTEFLPSILD